MATPKFYIRAVKTDPAPIYIRLSAGRGNDIHVKSGISIDPDKWSNKRAAPKIYDRPERNIEKIREQLNSLSEFVITELRNGNPTKEWLIDVVARFHKPQSSKVNGLNEYISAFIDESRDGDKRNKNAMNFSPGTVRSWQGFQRIFNEYQGVYTAKRLKKIKEPRPVKLLDFDDIDAGFYDSFIKFLTNEGFKVNTIGRFIKILKYFMQKSLDEKLHNNRDFQNKSVFRGITEPSFSIYLTPEELDSIYNFDLSKYPKIERARDAFIVLSETALRVSDYSKIGINIRIKDGVRLIYISQTKTGGEVVIPLSSRLEEILEKYNGRLPNVHENYINKYIKSVCAWCKVDERLSWESSKYGKKYTKTAKKYEIISCHTARRSACTNLYLAGVPVIDIMKISGHNSESQFMKYIKITREQTALRLAAHPYFSRLRVVN